MKILVTGAAGSVGRYVIESLIKEYDIIAFDKVKGQKYDNVTWVLDDILNFESLIKVAKGCDCIIHLVGIPVYDPKRNLDFGYINILGTQTILEVAVRCEIKRVIFASSICANAFIFWHKVRLPKYFPIDEGYVDLPDDMYGLSKFIGEQLAFSYENRYGLNVICLRLATVWFPNNVNKWLPTLLDKENDDDLEIRDLRWQYVDVRDVAKAFSLAVTTKKNIGICNVGAADCPGGDWRIWLTDLYPEVKELRYPGKYLADPTLPLWSISRFTELTGYQPKYSWNNYPVFVEKWKEYLNRRKCLSIKL